MKLIGSLFGLVLWSVFTDGLRYMGRDKSDEKQPDEKPGKSDEKPVMPDEKPGKPDGNPLKGPVHRDNMQGEIVDQADTEFGMASRGDACVSWEEVKNNLEQQFQEGAPDLTNIPDEEKVEKEKVQKQVIADKKLMFEHADENGDGCVDKAEFAKAGEMEGPPSGFDTVREAEIGAEGLSEQEQNEDRLEFDAMDRNGDEQISRGEAYHYASGNMPEADISDDVLEELLFETDTNGDGFITFEEFEGSGQAYEGDGNEMKDAEPITLLNEWRSLKNFAPKDAVSQLALKNVLKKFALKAKKKMLARKSALKMKSSRSNILRAAREVECWLHAPCGPPQPLLLSPATTSSCLRSATGSQGQWPSPSTTPCLSSPSAWAASRWLLLRLGP